MIGMDYIIFNNYVQSMNEDTEKQKKIVDVKQAVYEQSYRDLVVHTLKHIYSQNPEFVEVASNLIKRSNTAKSIMEEVGGCYSAFLVKRLLDENTKLMIDTAKNYEAVLTESANQIDYYGDLILYLESDEVGSISIDIFRQNNCEIEVDLSGNITSFSYEFDSEGQVFTKVVNDTKVSIKDSKGLVVNDYDHGYGLVPVIDIHVDASSSSFWNPEHSICITEYVLTSTLIGAVDAANFLFQSTKQLILLGGDFQGEVSAGPNRIMQFSSTNIDKTIPPEVSVADIQNDTERFIKWHESALNNVRRDYQITETLGLNVSGESIRMSRIALTDKQRKIARIMSDTENRLIKLMSAMWNTVRSESVNPENFSIMFQSRPRFDDPSSEIEYNLKLAEGGLLSMADIYRSVSDPFATDEEAFEAIRNNSQFFRSLSARDIELI